MHSAKVTRAFLLGLPAARFLPLHRRIVPTANFFLISVLGRAPSEAKGILTSEADMRRLLYHYPQIT